MFKNVLVGVDGRGGGEDAIALARRLIADGGELTLAYVYAGNPHPHREVTPRLVEAAEYARHLLEEARERADVAANLRWRRSSSTGRGLHELAEVIDADLLVVGSSRRGLLGRVRLGDDTQSAINAAPCAVAIASAGYGGQPDSVIRTIGVGYDGSPESAHALQVARGLVTEAGAQLSACQVVGVPIRAFSPGPVPLSEVIETLVEEARGRVASLGVEAHTAYGEPAEELASYSASVDLLVVGSRDYGPFGRLVHGSTTRNLARSARCPLLVLTRAVREASVP